MHNDTVVQGSSEVPFMQDVKRWGVLTIGSTGLGNTRFTNEMAYRNKIRHLVRKSRAKRGGRLEPWTGARRYAHPEILYHKWANILPWSFLVDSGFSGRATVSRFH
jgi:hypothetical protein